MVVFRKKRTQYTVYKTHDQDLFVVRASFSLQESSGETPGGCKFLAVFDRQGEEVHAFACVVVGNDSGQKHGVAAANDHRALGLAGQFARLNGDGPAVV